MEKIYNQHTVSGFMRSYRRLAAYASATSDAARRRKEWALGLLLFEGHTQDVGFKQLYVKGVCDRCLRRKFPSSCNHRARVRLASCSER